MGWQGFGRTGLAGLLLLAMSAFPGCGGGQEAAGPGTLQVSLVWPPAARLVPSAAQAVRCEVALPGSSSVLATAVIVRPETSATLGNLPAGPVVVRAAAYPGRDATGEPQAAAAAVVTIVAGQTTTLPLTLASTIATFAITPAVADLTVGGQAQLTATARNAAGALVIVPPMRWTVAEGAGVVSLPAPRQAAQSSLTVTGLASGVAVVSAVVEEVVGDAATAREATAQVRVLPAAPTRRLHGLNVGPFVDGGDPNQGAVVSETRLTELLLLATAHADWVRSFGCRAGQEPFGRLAHSFGRKAAVGCWIGRDQAANRQEIDALKARLAAGEVDLAVVGSEVLRRGDLSPAALLAWIQEVKQAAASAPNAPVPVATADVYGELLQHPEVLAAGDVVLANFYPFWEAVPVEQAVANLDRMHWVVQDAAGGRPVWVSETGWPDAGNAQGAAVPSPANAAAYARAFCAWAAQEGVPYFYFEAFNEPYKVAEEGPVGAHWGVWSEALALKPGFVPVFEDPLPAVAIDRTPRLELTFVPPVGSPAWVTGRAWYVRPADHRVVLYINVAGGWWIKPTDAQPTTVIAPAGDFTIDYDTGGNDVAAGQMVAYLVPAGYQPPLLHGAANLPAELEQVMVAKVAVTR